ncbi:unnamed protein product [Paramecium octaurelia]|uniref:Uncharacterized protein n=1 Tax=Paramecium octaurelia TaxID=43137 RepID=A0A8S1YB43_PAROT|nr:unnamed protein product [Paramecium octaurelia]
MILYQRILCQRQYYNILGQVLQSYKSQYKLEKNNSFQFYIFKLELFKILQQLGQLLKVNGNKNSILWPQLGQLRNGLFSILQKIPYKDKIGFYLLSQEHFKYQNMNILSLKHICYKQLMFITIFNLFNKWKFNLFTNIQNYIIILILNSHNQYNQIKSFLHAYLFQFLIFQNSIQINTKISCM